MKKNTSSGQSAFALLNSLGLREEEWRAPGIAPQTLAAIYQDFSFRAQELTAIASFTASTLQYVHEVHAARYRVKDPVHLLRKIIRKKFEYPDRTIDEHNYVDWINDLAGVRVLYLYKTSWQPIGQFIKDRWELKRPPIAYISAGEAESVVNAFAAAGCDIRRHEHGYRAVHFVIRTQPNRQRYFVEIQLRTLFEEGWSEIDHTIRYPNHRCSATIRELLSILNHLTGQADQLASFIRALLNTVYAPGQISEEERLKLFDQLQSLHISQTEKRRVYEQMERILTQAN